jgi:hypothetical protein
MFRPKMAANSPDRCVCIRRSGVQVLRWLLAAGLATGIPGCERPPQFAAENLHVIAALGTAVSERSLNLVGANATRIEELHRQGKLTDEQAKVLQQVIDAARAGDWKGAEQQILRVEKAQRPH